MYFVKKNVLDQAGHYMVLRDTKAKHLRCLKLRGPTGIPRIRFSEIAGMEVKTKDDGFFLPSLLEGKFYNFHPQR